MKKNRVNETRKNNLVSLTKTIYLGETPTSRASFFTTFTKPTLTHSAQSTVRLHFCATVF